MDIDDIARIIKEDEWMMEILKVVRTLNLPDWYIGAGFVRGKVWDTLHNYRERTPIPDIDVIYFDRDDSLKEEVDKDTTQIEIKYEGKLKKLMPELNWSVTNQARMHVYHGDKPYSSSEEAMGQWVETATCIGVRLEDNDNLVVAAPRGIDDLVKLVLRPTPVQCMDLDLFKKRVYGKNWLKKWPKLKVIV